MTSGSAATTSRQSTSANCRTTCNGCSTHGASATSTRGITTGKALRLSNDNVYWELRDDIVKAFFCTESRSEILKISNAWKDRKNDSEEILNALEGFLHAMLAVRFRSREGKELEALPACWQSFANSADPELFDTLSETVREARRRLSFNVSFQQVFESLILTFMGVMEKWKK